jgi:3-phosphoshikimate 1-carboxyvinyltransferase
MKINPAIKLLGRIALPGDKSISHRAGLLLAMASGRSNIENYASSEDCRSTLNCLRDLGVEIIHEGSTVSIEGVGKRGFSRPQKPLDCGNSGTTMRLMAGIMAGQDFDSVLTGDQSLSARPMKRIIEPLTRMNARVESTDNRPPLKIYGGNPLSAIDYLMPVPSAQVKSCILLAGLNAVGKSRVLSPASPLPMATSRDHTEIMLRFLGADIYQEMIESGDGFTHRVTIDGSSKLSARNLKIPADISSAAFFLTAAACLPGSELVLPNVGINPTRTIILDVLKRFGAQIEILEERQIGGESVGDLRVRGSADFAPPDGLNMINGGVIANLIDEIPVLAVFGTQIDGGLEIRDAGELRVKESDRIAATVENLRRMGAEVDEFPDGLRVRKSNLQAARIDSFGDHRIAMAFAIAGLLANGETEIIGSDCAGVSFPGFFDVLKAATER